MPSDATPGDFRRVLEYALAQLDDWEIRKSCDNCTPVFLYSDYTTLITADPEGANSCFVSPTSNVTSICALSPSLLIHDKLLISTSKLH